MSETLTMPWKGIAKLTAGFGLILTGICAAAIREEKRQEAQRTAYRWTDKNRWE